MTTSQAIVEVDLERVRANAAAVGARVAAGVELWATIKADAYGLGAAAVADALADRVQGFCVFSLEEAVAIGLWKRTGMPAIAMGPPTTLDPAPWIKHRVRPAVSTVEQARALRTARPILCVDTGMQRFACAADDAEAVIAAGGIDEAFTHATRLEHARKLRLVMGGRRMKLHAAATSLLEEPEAWLDAVRPGLALYDKALRVTAPLVEARTTGGPVGYGAWECPTGFHGVIQVGYSAGLRPGPALVNGRRQRIVEVGMQSAYVTLDGADRAGDEVVLAGKGLALGRIAEAWGVSAHEVLVRMARIGRKAGSMSR